jgi:hypothetical protein
MCRVSQRVNVALPGARMSKMASYRLCILASIFWRAHLTGEDFTGCLATLAYHHTLLAPAYSARVEEIIVAATEHRYRVSEIDFVKDKHNLGTIYLEHSFVSRIQIPKDTAYATTVFECGNEVIPPGIG